jgi:integrase
VIASPILRLHDLRHGAASELLAAGLDVVTVAKRLGHANPRTTLAIYGHVIEGQDRKAADILAERLG